MLTTIRHHCCVSMLVSLMAGVFSACTSSAGLAGRDGMQASDGKEGLDRPPLGDSVGAGVEGTAGYLDRVSRLNLRGWACSPGRPSASVRVYFSAALPGQGVVAVGETVAALNREAAVGVRCGGSVAHGFRSPTPAALLDGQDHQVHAFFDAARTRPLSNSPLTFNSHVLYRQELISDIRFHVGTTGYSAEILSAHPELHDYYLDANANAPLDEDTLFADKTKAFFHLPSNGTLPLPSALDPWPVLEKSCVQALTGLNVPSPYAIGQRGIDASTAGDCTGPVNAVQARGSAIGISLAPNAVYGHASVNIGLIPSYNMTGRETPSRAPRVFGESLDSRVRVEGYFRHPTNHIDRRGSHRIADEGLTFYYYTLQFRDTVHTSQKNRSIWFTVRLFQDKFVQPSEHAQLQDTDVAVFVDRLPCNSKKCSCKPSDPCTALTEVIGGIDTILRETSPRITPCPGTAYFSTSTHAAEKKYCFELSGHQFQQGLRDFNAAKFLDGEDHTVGFSENPADYSLVHFNVNAEVWRPGADAKDPRMGFSFRDALVTMIDP